MIPYIPDFYSKAEADALLEFCKTLPHQRKPNGHWGHSLLRRLSYPGWSVPFETHRHHGYGGVHQPLDQMPPLYVELAARLSAYAEKSINYFSTIGYETERDGMNWHQHKEDKVREDQSVWVLSLGDEHLIGLREKGDENKNNWECFYPAHGSLYVLPSAFNTTHEHAVLPDTFSRGLRIGINCKHIPVLPTPSKKRKAIKVRPLNIKPALLLATLGSMLDEMANDGRVPSPEQKRFMFQNACIQVGTSYAAGRKMLANTPMAITE